MCRNGRTMRKNNCNASVKDASVVEILGGVSNCFSNISSCRKMGILGIYGSMAQRRGDW